MAEVLCDRDECLYNNPYGKCIRSDIIIDDAGRCENYRPDSHEDEDDE